MTSYHQLPTTMNAYHLLAKQASAEPLTLGLKPFKPAHGAVLGGAVGAGLGAGVGGAVGGIGGLGNVLFDGEDDGLKSSLVKILRGALTGGTIGAAGGGLLGAGQGALSSQLAREDIRAQFKREHPYISKIPGTDARVDRQLGKQVISLREVLLGLQGKSRDAGVIIE